MKVVLETLRKSSHVFTISINSVMFVSASFLILLFILKVFKSKQVVYFILLFLNNEISLCYKFAYENSFDNIP